MIAVLLAIIGIYVLSLKALAEENFDPNEQVENLQLVEQSVLLPISSPPPPVVKSRITVMVTGYSSDTLQTDDTPFITASNKLVRDGIIANNLLPFGTKVRIPEIFGNKVFEVDDRMNRKKGDYHVDIWFSTREEAVLFGAQIATLEILAD